jgi:AAA domain
MKRFIITGAPGAGTTAIIRQLEIDGFSVVEEAATDVISAAYARGVPEPWKSPSFIDEIAVLQRSRQVHASCSRRMYSSTIVALYAPPRSHRTWASPFQQFSVPNWSAFREKRSFRSRSFSFAIWASSPRLKHAVSVLKKRYSSKRIMKRHIASSDSNLSSSRRRACWSGSEESKK